MGSQIIVCCFPRQSGSTAKRSRAEKPAAKPASFTRVGTCHFIGIKAAERYYAQYGHDAADVAEKLASGEIALGAPTVKHGQTVGVISGEGRYYIETKEA